MSKDFTKVYRNLPGNVRKLRIANGWSQAELARRSGLSQPQISRIEGAAAVNPQISTILSLAHAFKVMVESLCGV